MQRQGLITIIAMKKLSDCRNCVSFHASCKLTRLLDTRHRPGRARYVFVSFPAMYRNNHGRFFRAFRLRSVRDLLFRYFPTISGLGATNRKGHSWPACKSAAPCKSACNSGQRRKRGWHRERGGRAMKGKEELRSTRIANYP